MERFLTSLHNFLRERIMSQATLTTSTQSTSMSFGFQHPLKVHVNLVLLIFEGKIHVSPQMNGFVHFSSILKLITMMMQKKSNLEDVLNYTK
jgi:hypothetical protein